MNTAGDTWNRLASARTCRMFNSLRQQILNGFPLTPEPYAYLYSDRIDMPAIPDTDFLFLPGMPHQIYLPLVGVNISTSITTTPPTTLSLTLPGTGQVGDYTSIFGEDSDYSINPPAYTVTGNGVVTDQVTSLMWQQSDGGEMTYANAITYCQNLELAGYSDWTWLWCMNPATSKSCPRSRIAFNQLCSCRACPDGS